MKPLGIGRAGFNEFRGNHDRAVTAGRLFGEIILMLRFGWIVVDEWCDFSDDRIIPVSLGTVAGGFEEGLLCVGLIQHARTVLRANISTLAVEGGGVMDEEENIDQCLRWQDRLVELHLHNLGVAGSATCHPVIIREATAIGVATFNQFDATKLSKDGVGTPEAATTKDKLCHTSSIRRYTKEVNEQTFRELIWQKGHELYRDMPWRQDTRPYYVLVSELMLQQTQVDRVVPKFEAFITRFPDEATLAAASLSEVLTLWSGLGYNRRAKYLHEAAKMIMGDCGGVFPATYAGLLKLPGVGPNTAGAIMAYAYNQPVVFIETNVRTVYFTHWFDGRAEVHDRELRAAVEATVDREQPREFYWALMDYGSWLKRQGGGRLTMSRHYKKQAPLKGSVREVRGQLVKRLALGDVPLAELVAAYDGDGRFEPALTGLLADGLVQQSGEQLHLTK